MRLPLNPAQWGAFILQALIQQFPTVEPYVQYTQALGSDVEGNGYGIIPVNNTVIPYVVRSFELKPFDILIATKQGEACFSYLSDPNLMAAFNNVTMGQVVNQLPPTIDEDVFLDMLPPYAAAGKGFGNSRRPAPGVQQGYNRVKLSSHILDLEDDQVDQVFAAMKVACAEHAIYAMQYTLRAARDTADIGVTTKAASLSPVNKLVTVDPRPSGDVQLGLNNHFETVSLKTAATLVNAITAEDLPRLLAGEMLVYDYRPGYKQAAQSDPGHVGYFEGAPYKAQTVYADNAQRRSYHQRAVCAPLAFPGWYDVPLREDTHPRTCRVFNTKQLNGKPSVNQLFVFESGYSLHPVTSAVPHAPSTTPVDDRLVHYYRKARVAAGELCFLVYHETDEASTPFMINSVNISPAGITTLQVTPITPIRDMAPVISLSFGKNQHMYVLSPSEIAFPQKGYTIFSLHPRELTNEVGMDGFMPPPGTFPTVHVQVYKGGGLYRIKEQTSAPSEPLTRGQFVQFCMTRYGMDADIALKTLDDINSYKYDKFVAAVMDESRHSALPMLHEPFKLAMDLFGVVKGAAGLMNSGSGTTPASMRGGSTNSGSGPGSSDGVVGDTNSAPIGSGRGAPNELDTSAGVPPQVEGVAAVADTLLGYATSTLPEDELSELNKNLITQLEESQNAVGRLLLLVRMGKLKYLTELELQRMFRECDKFRANLINVSVARGNFMMPTV